MYSRLDESYIPRERLIELATRFKDCVNGDDDLEYVKDDMTDNELRFFEMDEKTTEDMEIDDDILLEEDDL